MSIIESFPKGSSSKVNINYQFAPIGTIISLMGKSAPEGYLVCDGSYYDIDTYKNLADYFQSQFGSTNYFGGNGTTTFAVPDLRGEFLRGTGTNSHSNQGNGGSVGEHQNATQHLRETLVSNTGELYVYTDGTQYKGHGNADSYVGTTTSQTRLVGQVQSVNQSDTYTSRPTNTSILWCIKATKTNDIQTTNYVYGYTPVGTIITMSGQCPQDFHECDGSILNISEYPELAEYYKDSFGSYNYYGGNGTTTFGIPDLRGEFIRGTGSNSHTNQGSGAAIGVHQDATLINNTFMQRSSKSMQVTSANSNADAWQGNVNWDSTRDGKYGVGISPASYEINDTSNIGSGTTRPTNTSVLFCVALKNIIPVEPSESEETTGGHIILDNGTELDEQPVLNFTDFDIENDTENNETDIKTHRLTEEELDEIFDEQPNILGITPNIGFTPVGTIISVMGNSAPSNYLICDGSEVLIMEYPDLAKYFEEQFGTKNHFGGNGTTTFAVPDLRGEFLRGTGTNSHSGQGNGGNVGAHQNSTSLPNIYYQFNGYLCKYAGSLSNSANDSHINNYDSSISIPYTLKADFKNTSAISMTGNMPDQLTVRPTNTSVLYCIAVKNIYIDPKYDYSTYEKVVGTWIDGKPIYQKTLNNLSIGGSWYQQYRFYLPDQTPLISDVNNIIDVKGYVSDGSCINVDINIVNGKWEYGRFTSDTLTALTVQYTKTTD